MSEKPVTPKITATVSKLSFNKLTNKNMLMKLVEHSLVDVPATLRVVDTTNGVFEDKQRKIPYAKLVCADLIAYQALESVGLEATVPTYDLKLKGYAGEELDSLIGKDVDTAELPIDFSTDKFGNITGTFFRESLSALKLT